MKMKQSRRSAGTAKAMASHPPLSDPSMFLHFLFVLEIGLDGNGKISQGSM